MNSPNIRLFLSTLYFLRSNHTTLNSDKIFMIFDCCMHNMIHRRYMDPKCVLALIFATAFEITNFAKLKRQINFQYMAHQYVKMLSHNQNLS